MWPNREAVSPVSLGALVDALGITVLRVAAAPQGLGVPVSGVALHDPGEPLGIVAGELVLGLGVRDPLGISALLAEVGQLGAAALVVKYSGDDVVAPEGGAALLHLARPASWSQVTTLLRQLVETPGVGLVTGETSEDGDLFAIADAVSVLIDAPLVIEDRAARVLAFSARQEEADVVRTRTILARRDPAEYVDLHQRHDVFDRLYASPVPLVFEPVGEEELPRVAVALRAGDQIVGSMWAATRGELTAARLAAFADAAKTVALHVLQARVLGDVAGRLRGDLLARVLAGGSGSAEAAGRLGFPGRTFGLAAVQLRQRAVPGEELLADLASTLGLHLAAVRSGCVVTRSEQTVYAAVPLEDADTTAITRLLEDFATRVASRLDVVAGVGRPVRSVVEAQRSRADCDKVVRVVRSGEVTRAVARIADVQLQVLLLRLSDTLALGEDELDGPATALLEYDAANDARLAETLLTHFAVFGDANAAADRLHVHPNTYRYRLRRVSAVSGLDVEDSDALLAAVLQIRLHRLARNEF